MVREGRLRCRPPRLVCGVSPSVCVVVPLNGGGCVACGPLVLCGPCPLHSVPCLRIRSDTPHCLVPLALHSLVLCCSLPLHVAVLLCCVRRTGGWCVVCVVSL